MTTAIANGSGLLGTTLKTIYSPSVNKKGVIGNIKFSNEVQNDYLLQVYIVKNGNVPRLLYSQTLTAGDWVDDGTNYELWPGDALMALSNNTTTNFIITGHEEDL